MQMSYPAPPKRNIRYTLVDASSVVYELTCQVQLRVDAELEQARVVFRPIRGTFRIGCVGVLLADVRTIYLETGDGVGDCRLSEVVVLELVDRLPDADITWLQRQAWLLGIELVVRQLSSE